MGHSLANDEAKVINRTLLEGIKGRLVHAKGYWIDKLHHVLWAYRTIQRISIGETHFSPAFGIEAIILVEIGLPFLKVEEYNEETNSKWLQVNLDLLKKSKERATIRIASYHLKVATYYNVQVKAKEFRLGDLAL